MKNKNFNEKKVKDERLDSNFFEINKIKSQQTAPLSNF